MITTEKKVKPKLYVIFETEAEKEICQNFMKNIKYKTREGKCNGQILLDALKFYNTIVDERRGQA